MTPMTDQPKKELSAEELKKAAGGFDAKKVRNKDEVGQADLTRVSGGAIPASQHQVKDPPKDDDQRRARGRDQGGQQQATR